MAKRKQVWHDGDLFAVPLPDGTAALGQVVGREPEALNSIRCAFFRIRLPSESRMRQIPTLEDLISCLFTSRDLLDRGTWNVIGRSTLVVPVHLFPGEQTRSRGWVGAKVIGSTNVTDFLAAFHSLIPWDDWKDPAYLDHLLIGPEKKPTTVLLKHSRPDGV